MAGSAASSENSRGHSSLSKDVDTSTTPVHVSSDDESPAQKIWTACLPRCSYTNGSQSSDEEFGNGISPMVFHSQELMDDDLFAVKDFSDHYYKCKQ